MTYNGGLKEDIKLTQNTADYKVENCWFSVGGYPGTEFIKPPRVNTFTYAGRALSSYSEDELKDEMERRRLSKLTDKDIVDFFDQFREANRTPTRFEIDIETLVFRGLEQVKKGY